MCLIFLLFSYEDVVELLLKHGARVDVEARMCWPGPHQQNCEERCRHSRPRNEIMNNCRSFDKLQCAIYYAIDGDQVRDCCSYSIIDCILYWSMYLQRLSVLVIKDVWKNYCMLDLKCDTIFTMLLYSARFTPLYQKRREGSDSGSKSCRNPQHLENRRNFLLKIEPP